MTTFAAGQRGVPGDRQVDIGIVGGAGHVGLPLAIVFASRGRHVLIYDINHHALERIRQGELQFMERGAQPLLKEAVEKGLLSLSSDPAKLAGVPTIIITVGTPVDEFLNPTLKGLVTCLNALLPHLSDEQTIILRSTVSPGVTEWIDRYLQSKGKRLKVAFCPERVVQGFAIEELQKVPQIVSGTTPEAAKHAAEVFALCSPEVVHLSPMEAEFAKLFNNAYRYVQFALANQFFMIANSAGLDYYRILEGMRKKYPRAGDLPRAGFAAGPCLFKDTVHLVAFSGNRFSLGQAAMLVNEGLPFYIVEQIARTYELSNLTVGLLGMAFKADSDDSRSSLSYKLKKILRFRAKEVLTTDPYVTQDPNLLPLDEVIAGSDILILCAPHSCYRHLDVSGKIVIDIWNCLGGGAKV